MTTAYEIPLLAQPQTFVVTLAGGAYRLTLRWCGAAGSWVLDLATSLGDPLISGMPVVPGCDLLSQYEYIGVGGGLFVQTLGDTGAIPTFENLGVNGLLFFVTP